MEENQRVEVAGLKVDVKRSACGGVVLAATLPAQSVDKESPRKEEEAPVVTHHSLKVGGRTLNYTVTTGMMPLKSEEGETEASLFFMAYTLDEPGAVQRRPLMFSFNGGPGSSSVWLHLGALGPRRVKMLPDGNMPPPPFEMVDNEHTWLDLTDLVFIDPVGTGYSRPAKPDLGKKFWGLRSLFPPVSFFAFPWGTCCRKYIFIRTIAENYRRRKKSCAIFIRGCCISSASPRFATAIFSR